MFLFVDCYEHHRCHFIDIFPNPLDGASVQCLWLAIQSNMIIRNVFLVLNYIHIVSPFNRLVQAFSVCLWTYVSICPPLALSINPFLSVSLSHFVSLSLPLSLFLSISLVLSLPLSPDSLYVCLSLPVPLYMPLLLSISRYVCLYMYFSLSTMFH